MLIWGRALGVISTKRRAKMEPRIKTSANKTFYSFEIGILTWQSTSHDSPKKIHATEQKHLGYHSTTSNYQKTFGTNTRSTSIAGEDSSQTIAILIRKGCHPRYPSFWFHDSGREYQNFHPKLKWIEDQACFRVVIGNVWSVFWQLTWN